MPVMLRAVTLRHTGSNIVVSEALANSEGAASFGLPLIFPHISKAYPFYVFALLFIRTRFLFLSFFAQGREGDAPQRMASSCVHIEIEYCLYQRVG